MVRTALVAFALCVSPPALAGETLWRTLEAGDTPETVQAKLATMPEIKRVKTKKKSDGAIVQDINMNDGGIPIFAANFSLTTEYRAGALSMVTITNEFGCLQDGYTLARSITDELAKKYPAVANPLGHEAEFMARGFEATSLEPTRMTAGYYSDETAAIFAARFIKIDPPSYYGGSAFNRSLYNLSRTIYNQRAAGCGGLGYRNVQLAISYVTRANFDEVVKQAGENQKAAQKQAADNL